VESEKVMLCVRPFFKVKSYSKARVIGECALFFYLGCTTILQVTMCERILLPLAIAVETGISFFNAL